MAGYDGYKAMIYLKSNGGQPKGRGAPTVWTGGLVPGDRPLVVAGAEVQIFGSDLIRTDIVKDEEPAARQVRSAISRTFPASAWSCSMEIRTAPSSSR